MAFLLIFFCKRYLQLSCKWFFISLVRDFWRQISRGFVILFRVLAQNITTDSNTQGFNLVSDEKSSEKESFFSLTKRDFSIRLVQDTNPGYVTVLKNLAFWWSNGNRTIFMNLKRSGRVIKTCLNWIYVWQKVELVACIKEDSLGKVFSNNSSRLRDLTTTGLLREKVQLKAEGRLVVMIRLIFYAFLLTTSLFSRLSWCFSLPLTNESLLLPLIFPQWFLPQENQSVSDFPPSWKALNIIYPGQSLSVW